MWSHYSEGHKGFVVEIDTDIAFAVPPEIIPIVYTKEPPEFDYLDGNLPKNTSTQKAFQRDILGRKSDIWAYENEHRIQFDLNILKVVDRSEKKVILVHREASGIIKYI